MTDTDYTVLSDAELDAYCHHAMMCIAPHLKPVFEKLRREYRAQVFSTGDFTTAQIEYNHLNKIQMLIEGAANE